MDRNEIRRMLRIFTRNGEKLKKRGPSFRMALLSTHNLECSVVMDCGCLVRMLTDYLPLSHRFCWTPPCFATLRRRKNNIAYLLGVVWFSAAAQARRVDVLQEALYQFFRTSKESSNFKKAKYEHTIHSIS